MREGFEKQLHVFGDRSKKEKRRMQNDGDEEVGSEIEHMQMIADAAVAMGTSERAQEEVFFKQQKKQEIMNMLHERLRALDRVRKFEYVGKKEGKTVYFDDQSGRYFQRGEKNEGVTQMTKGDMMTDGMWGVTYRMDFSIPRNVAKRFFIETARREIHDLLDDQISITEAESDINRGSGNDTAYEAIHERGKDREETEGELAERMTQSYLRKLSYDYDVPFKVIDSDPEMDVEDKIDFILRFDGHDRGVSVNVGVQFTTSVKEMTIRKKEYQIAQVKKRLSAEKDAPVQDLILVSIPIHETLEVYTAWNKNKKKNPGGPDALWSKETKRLVFEGVFAKLHNIITEDEIISLWEKIESEMTTRH
ncbi:MAG: hypothetical protein G01um101448_163 [Parcubacteria group bacterium Gr01-1014_48]|nr:MAG: hypothetical protein Greene041614_711 [Parcubacteria group bacterium Greene0416_14]TSC74348.1 MAG: hypothetical protein G01um101448_163 [Parcubacteria group bacterium Gr01-1014_48]TSD00735.1 MAG: hypothetical protein Greene101415_735 [Parcubacteria group bacterium Greene1014_15]TSD07857.1 MAG: hypothetical protein Greene07144_661 [Parcubacteria group bacterium Greene0714_4]